MALLKMKSQNPERPVTLLWSTVVLVALYFAAFSAAPLPAQDFSDEGKIKAGLLFNFAKFITWPAIQNPGTRATLVFCVVGDSATSGILKTQAEGKFIGEKQVVVRELPASARFEGCQLLFIGNREKATREILKAVRNLPLVTVGEDPHFLGNGGIINLLREDGRFKFQIRLGNALRFGILISSRLLQLARDVETG